jgi:hypothetical protein
MTIRENVVNVDVITNDLIMGQLLTLTKWWSTLGELKHWLMNYIEKRCHLTRINQLSTPFFTSVDMKQQLITLEHIFSFALVVKLK